MDCTLTSAVRRIIDAKAFAVGSVKNSSVFMFVLVKPLSRMAVQSNPTPILRSATKCVSQNRVDQ